MYKVIPHKMLFLAVGWLIFGCIYVVNAVDEIIRADWLRSSQGVTAAWLLGSLVFWKPVWRRLWKWFPILNRLIFPDLNGTWDVEMRSNWPIQKQLIDAAARRSDAIDVEQCPETDLASLQDISLKAEIDQSWFKIEILMWNPKGDTPIDRSDVCSAEPFRLSGLKPGGLFYFFKQQNRTQNLADDNEFYGAARIEHDSKSDTLKGRFWTARMWGRGMNTAGLITYRRSK